MVKPKVAGIVVYKMVNKKPFYLGLWTGDFYDLTKGHIDGNESAIEAARRETREESNVTHISLHSDVGVFNGGELVMFVGKTSDTPFITPNPETGEYEHMVAKWLPYEKIIKKIKPELADVIRWANKILSKTVY